MRRYLVLFLFAPALAQAFFLRAFMDPEHSCGDNQSAYQGNLECFNKESISPLNEDIQNLGEDLERKVIHLYEDLKAMESLSEKIIWQAGDSLKDYELQLKLSQLDTPAHSEGEFAQGLNAMAKIEEAIALINYENQCEANHADARGTTLLERCREKRAQELAPFIEQKLLLQSSYPLLAQPAVQNFLEESTEERVNSGKTARLKLQRCEFKKIREKELDCSDHIEKISQIQALPFDFKRDDYLATYQKGLGSGIKGSKELLQRHQKIDSELKVLFSKSRSVADLENARDDLLHDRKIATDYFVGAGAGTKTQGSAFGSFGCRLDAEYDINSKNALINSLALDLAIMAIPMGGPLLMARAAMRLKNLGSLGSKLSKAASGSRLATLSGELGLMGIDAGLVHQEAKHCEQIMERSLALRAIPERQRGEYQSCKEQINTMTLAYVGAVVGGSLGMIRMNGKLIKAGNSKNFVEESLESKIDGESLQEMKNIKAASQLPLLSRGDVQTLSLLDDTDKVVVRYTPELGKAQEATLSAAEAKKLLNNGSFDSFSITGVKSGKSFGEAEQALSRSKMDRDVFDRIDKTPEELHSVTVTFPSGEMANYRGNADMLTELAQRKDIVRISTKSKSEEVLSGYEVPLERRSPDFDLDSDLYGRISPDSKIIISAGSDGGFADLPLSHGTISAMEDSVKSGPKNVGAGFGGRGLYIDVSEDAKIATEYASHAKGAAANRLSHVRSDSNAELSPDEMREVVLRGKLNMADKELTVGRFEIRRGGKVDLENGVLPHDWDNDPRLVRMMEEKFDILDLRGMRSNNLNLDTDRFLIIHERAGADIVDWN